MQNKKIIKKSKSNFLTIAILPSFHMSLESKITVFFFSHILNQKEYNIIEGTLGLNSEITILIARILCS